MLSSVGNHSQSTGTPTSTHVVIVGGGLSGLSAAYALERASQVAGTNMQYTLIERDDRLGGKVLTDTLAAPDAFVVEGGPDSFIAQKPWALDLIRELGLGDEVIGANTAKHATYIFHNNHPLPLPEGLALLVPTKFWPFVRSPLFSWRGKLRMALDLIIPARRDAADETLASFVRRRLGQEALDTLGEPLLGGIHSCATEQQSLLATFPRFRALEAQHGSLIRGMRAQRRRSEVKGQGSGASTSPFLTLRGGMQTLTDALAHALTGRVLVGRGVASLERVREGGYTLLLDNGEQLSADAVILTTPAYAAADLVAPWQPALGALLRRIRYVSTATITLAYRQSEVAPPLDGFGMVIPHGAQRQINAVTLSAQKFAQRAPTGYTLVRVFVGGARHPELLARDDDALLALAREELRALFGISAAPVVSRLYRWMRAQPQYDLGHLERVDAIEAACPPGLYLAGSAYRGVGIPDCVRQGQAAAAQTLAYLCNQPVQPGVVAMEA